MKAHRRSMVPVETLCDESSLMIIEEEEEAKSREREREGMKLWQKFASSKFVIT